MVAYQLTLLNALPLEIYRSTERSLELNLYRYLTETRWAADLNQDPHPWLNRAIEAERRLEEFYENTNLAGVLNQSLQRHWGEVHWLSRRLEGSEGGPGAGERILITPEGLNNLRWELLESLRGLLRQQRRLEEALGTFGPTGQSAEDYLRQCSLVRDSRQQLTAFLERLEPANWLGMGAESPAGEEQKIHLPNAVLDRLNQHWVNRQNQLQQERLRERAESTFVFSQQRSRSVAAPRSISSSESRPSQPELAEDDLPPSLRGSKVGCQIPGRCYRTRFPKNRGL